ncbi:MAG: ribokinase [Rhodothermales bacterium]|jgi:ribokinase
MPVPRIAVFGSLNLDHSFCVPRIPLPGETLIAQSANSCFGGKGANQAIAAARAGAAVQMAGCVGDDDAGHRYIAYLKGEGVCTDAIQLSAEAATGSAFIAVDSEGENSIIVNPGANHAVVAAELPPVDVLLLQLECPLSEVAKIANSAHAAGTRVILNPSPWDDAVLAAGMPIDVLIVNQREAAQAGDRLRADMCIITNGAAPTLVYSANAAPIAISPPSVDPVDTVGAGDAFAGAFAVAYARGLALADAIAFANSAAALATLKAGAQMAIPTRTAIEAFQATGPPGLDP